MNRKLLFSLFLFVAANVYGALQDCEYNAVKTAVGNAKDNDVVELPVCTATWPRNAHYPVQ